MTKIEQQDTADASDTSGELAVHKELSEVSEMATKKHRLALAAGICGILLLSGIVAVVAGMVGKSFSHSSSGTTDDEFDFSDVPEYIRGPSSTPSVSPTLRVTTDPTSSPTNSPTTAPTKGPTVRPSVAPTIAPTPLASASPTRAPSPPTVEPTMMPNTNAPITPVNYTSPTLLTFCVIADVPYNDDEKVKLPLQIANQMENCEFLVHLGDIMKGDIGCDDEHYMLVKNMMLESKVPGFIVPGDNEWNDCGDARSIDVAWGRWTDHFMHFENNWNHTLSVVRQPQYRENFYFIKKRTLVVGLNIVGGRVHDQTEWQMRHEYEMIWLRQIVSMNVPDNADAVIVMAHAKPTEDHDDFFLPFRNFVRDELKNEVPVLYLHGDGHDFIYTPNFLSQPNFLRIQHEGGVRDPILKIMADPQYQGNGVYDVFQYDQQLHLE